MHISGKFDQGRILKLVRLQLDGAEVHGVAHLVEVIRDVERNGVDRFEEVHRRRLHDQRAKRRERRVKLSALSMCARVRHNAHAL